MLLTTFVGDYITFDPNDNLVRQPDTSVDPFGDIDSIVSEVDSPQAVFTLGNSSGQNSRASVLEFNGSDVPMADAIQVFAQDLTHVYQAGDNFTLVDDSTDYNSGLYLSDYTFGTPTNAPNLPLLPAGLSWVLNKVPVEGTEYDFSLVMQVVDTYPYILTGDALTFDQDGYVVPNDPSDANGWNGPVNPYAQAVVMGDQGDGGTYLEGFGLAVTLGDASGINSALDIQGDATIGGSLSDFLYAYNMDNTNYYQGDSFTILTADHLYGSFDDDDGSTFTGDVIGLDSASFWHLEYNDATDTSRASLVLVSDNAGAAQPVSIVTGQNMGVHAEVKISFSTSLNFDRAVLEYEPYTNSDGNSPGGHFEGNFTTLLSEPHGTIPMDGDGNYVFDINPLPTITSDLIQVGSHYQFRLVLWTADGRQMRTNLGEVDTPWPDHSDLGFTVSRDGNDDSTFSGSGLYWVAERSPLSPFPEQWLVKQDGGWSDYDGSDYYCVDNGQGIDHLTTPDVGPGFMEYLAGTGVPIDEGSFTYYQDSAGADYATNYYNGYTLPGVGGTLSASVSEDGETTTLRGWSTSNLPSGAVLEVFAFSAGEPYGITIDTSLYTQNNDGSISFYSFGDYYAVGFVDANNSAKLVTRLSTFVAMPRMFDVLTYAIGVGESSSLDLYPNLPADAATKRDGTFRLRWADTNNSEDFYQVQRWNDVEQDWEDVPGGSQVTGTYFEDKSGFLPNTDPDDNNLYVAYRVRAIASTATGYVYSDWATTGTIQTDRRYFNVAKKDSNEQDISDLSAALQRLSAITPTGTGTTDQYRKGLALIKLATIFSIRDALPTGAFDNAPLDDLNKLLAKVRTLDDSALVQQALRDFETQNGNMNADLKKALFDAWDELAGAADRIGKFTDRLDKLVHAANAYNDLRNSDDPAANLRGAADFLDLINSFDPVPGVKQIVSAYLKVVKGIAKLFVPIEKSQTAKNLDGLADSFSLNDGSADLPYGTRWAADIVSKEIQHLSGSDKADAQQVLDDWNAVKDPGD